MEREYYKKDRRVVVEEIENVRAVQVRADDDGAAPSRVASLGSPATDVVRSKMRGYARDETLAAFERANWRFVEPSNEVRRALERGEAVEESEEIGKVVIRDNGEPAIVTNRMTVQLQPSFSEEQCTDILAERQLEVLSKLNFATNLYEVAAQGYEDALAASVALHEDERFKMADPVFQAYIGQRATPADNQYARQWQWHNTGQTGGIPGADLRTEDAWTITRGAGVRVAVIDNGFDAQHEDLVAGISSQSGYFVHVPGSAANFVLGTSGMPASNHGTFCAGLVGGRQNNVTGGCGAAPECELILIAALPDQIGTQVTLARAVAYAANPTSEVSSASAGDGADVLVCSLGPNGAVWELETVLEMALEAAATNGRNGRGMAIFWAASNGYDVDVTLDEVVSHEDVIAVVRSDHNDLEDNAARGKTVEFIAPGVDVFSSYSNNQYGTGTGTSYAAPCVAGCAALVLAVDPDITRDELRQLMRDNTDKIGGVIYDANGHNYDYGFGRPNALKIVQEANRRLINRNGHGTELDARAHHYNEKVLYRSIDVDNPIRTPFPIEDGDSIYPARSDVNLQPNGTVTWYISGREGDRFSTHLTFEGGGGHGHGNGSTNARATGTITPKSGTIVGTYPQNIPQTYRAGEVCGRVRDNSTVGGQSYEETYHIAVGGLQALTASTGVVLVGSTATHGSNHWGTAGLCNAIRQLGAAFHAKFNKPIYVNDMSLQTGGLFDISANFQPPHQLHRDGRHVDMNWSSMTAAERTWFQAKAEEIGFHVEIHNNPTHWHLRYG